VYQQDSPSTSARRLLEHVFGDAHGRIVTFTARQARFSRDGARHNELTDIQQRSFSYPAAVEDAVSCLLEESKQRRDAYFGVHLFRKAGSRLASNSVGAMASLWLDEDDGRYPDDGPQPTAVVHSSASRRHLYWRLTRPMSAEWVIETNRRLAAWADGDVGKAGLATVLRVPGTRNFKRYPQVDSVTLQITEAAAWDPEIMDQAIPQLAKGCDESSHRGEYDGPEVELGEYLADVEVIRQLPDGLGVKYAIVCPWVHEHTGGDRTGTRVGQRCGGGLWFHCEHAHCFGRRWHEFRRRVRRLKKKSHLIKEGEYFG
jgi:hypothetical protein